MKERIAQLENATSRTEKRVTCVEEQVEEGKKSVEEMRAENSNALQQITHMMKVMMEKIDARPPAYIPQQATPAPQQATPAPQQATPAPQKATPSSTPTEISRPKSKMADTAIEHSFANEIRERMEERKATGPKRGRDYEPRGGQKEDEEGRRREEPQRKRSKSPNKRVVNLVD
eukprot:TRINITY_DN12730_c0_g1_i1.p1 TRINITY_DN12730_c0_g1~~TRINITY_DN12730_c0_g1_i1.p1  ORF type:complete len:174 (+),score=39.75 TRINITY_DN12730_c0_g1_i1:563-1084(+)